MGSLTVAAGPLSFKERSSSAFIKQDVLAVAMIDESKKAVVRIIFAYIRASFPLYPASCLLIIIRATSDAFSSSVQLVRNGSSDPVSFFTKALKVVHSFSYIMLVFGNAVVDLNVGKSCLL